MPHLLDTHLLSVILFTPLVGALLLLLIPRESSMLHRWVGNLFGVLGFVVSIPLVLRFPVGSPDYVFRETADWIPSIGAHYSLGIDGISFLLVMLTTLLGMIAILSSWSAIQMRTKEYYILLLLLQTGMLGVFLSLDFFLFYMFWEVMLVPMYFLIGVWGSDRRLYAAIKFFLYTLAGSVIMLLAILALYYNYAKTLAPGTPATFDIPTLLGGCAVVCGPIEGVAVLGILLRVCHQGADVPVPYLAAGRAHRSADGWLRDSGRRVFEDGNVRVSEVFAAVVAR